MQKKLAVICFLFLHPFPAFSEDFKKCGVQLRQVGVLANQEFEEILNVWAKLRSAKPKRLRKLLSETFAKKDTSTFIIRENGKIVSFAAINLEENPPLLEGTELATETSFNFTIAGTHPDYNQRGYYTELTRQRLQTVMSRFELNKHLKKKNYFHTVTQNPRVFQTIQNVLESYKSQGLIAGYSLKVKKTMKGFFQGDSLAKEVQSTSNIDAESFFSEIDTENGDAVVLAWELYPPSK